jgi:hypothetical protein
MSLHEKIIPQVKEKVIRCDYHDDEILTPSEVAYHSESMSLDLCAKALERIPLELLKQIEDHPSGSFVIYGAAECSHFGESQPAGWDLNHGVYAVLADGHNDPYLAKFNNLPDLIEDIRSQQETDDSRQIYLLIIDGKMKEFQEIYDIKVLGDA